jgi:hypothetical protein
MAPGFVPVLLIVTSLDEEEAAGCVGDAEAMEAVAATPVTESSPTPPATAARSRRWPVRDFVMFMSLVVWPGQVTKEK